VETRGLTLFHSQAGAFCCIPYPFAAIWDLLVRGYDFDDLARLTGYVAGTSPEEASRLVTQAIDGWVSLGVLAEAGDG
jgi:hypothetical protein